MAKSFWNFEKGVLLQGESSDPSDNLDGSIWFNSTSGRLKMYYSSAVRELVDTDSGQTLQTKTLDNTNSVSLTDSNFTLEGATNTAQFNADSLGSNRTFTLPDPGADDTLVTLDSTGVMTNKSFEDATFKIVDEVDNTKEIKFSINQDTGVFTTFRTNTTVSSKTIDFPDISDTVVTESATQDLQNKTASTGFKVGSGTLTTDTHFEVVSTGEASIPAPKMTEAQRDAISNPIQGHLIYNTDTSALNQYDGSAWVEVGSGGSGGINHVEGDDSDFESSVGGWLAENDSAASTPVDLTGVAATALSLSQETVAPLRGDGSLLITHDGTSGIGDVVRLDVTIDAADKGLVQEFSFDYETSAAYADDRLQVWVYDVTNTQLIQPTPFELKATGGNPGRFKAHFQAAIDSTSYRVAFFCPDSTLTGYTVKVENVKIGPPTYNFGAPITEWQSYTPTLSAGFGTPTIHHAYWRRVGSDMEIFGLITTGTVAASVPDITLPNGHTINTSIMGTSNHSLGSWHQGGTSTDDFSRGTVSVRSTVANDKLVLLDDFSTAASSGNPFVAANASVILRTGVTLGFNAKFPVNGWSTNVQMSDDADTRVVAMRAEISVAQSQESDGAFEKITFDNTVGDTHGGWNGTDYTIPVSGWYRLSSSIHFTSNVTGIRSFIITKNNSTSSTNRITQESKTANVGTGTISSLTGNDYLTAGETVQVWAYQNSGGNLAYSNSPAMHFSIEKITGPSAIAANETIAASYKSSAGQTLTTSTPSNINFETKIFDTHNAVVLGTLDGGTNKTTSDWKFVAPASGIYDLKVFATLASNANWSTDERAELGVTVNGSQIAILDTWEAQRTGTITMTLNGSMLVKLNAGQYLGVDFNQLTGADGDLLNNHDFVQIHINRIGM
jgi:hypothetical protein